MGAFFARLTRRGEPYDLAVSGWYFANTDPAPVVGMLAGKNSSRFDDPAFDRKLESASRLSGTKRYRTYSRLALALERDLAPVAAFSNNASRDFFSARIGCQVYQPVFGIDLAALCLRG